MPPHYLAHAEQSENLAHQWGIDYAASCDDGPGEDALEAHGKALQPLPAASATRLYRIH